MANESKYSRAHEDLGSRASASAFLGPLAEELAWRVGEILNPRDTALDPADFEVVEETSLVMRRNRAIRETRVHRGAEIARLSMLAAQTARRLRNELQKLMSALEPLETEVAARLEQRDQLERESELLSVPSDPRLPRFVGSRDSPESRAFRYLSYRLHAGIPRETPLPGALNDLTVRLDAFMSELPKPAMKAGPAAKPRQRQRKKAPHSNPVADLALHLACFEARHREARVVAKMLAAAEVIATGVGRPKLRAAAALCRKWEGPLLRARPLMPAMLRWVKERLSKLPQNASDPG